MFHIESKIEQSLKDQDEGMTTDFMVSHYAEFISCKNIRRESFTIAKWLSPKLYFNSANNYSTAAGRI